VRALDTHALVGKHFFPDANHRTAIVTLRKLLRDNGMEPGEWSTERVKRVRAESHDVRREIPPIHLGFVGEKTNCIASGFQFFGEVFLKSIADYRRRRCRCSRCFLFSSRLGDVFAISRSLSQFIVYRYLEVRTVKSVSLPGDAR